MTDAYITDKNIHNESRKAAILIAAYDVQDAGTQLKNVEGVKFSDEKGGFKTYQDLDKETNHAALNEKNISQIEIDNGNEKSYYRRIVDKDHSEKSFQEGKKGFRADAWVKTNDKGNPLVDKNGKAEEMVLAFPGYRGNPLEPVESPQTKSLHAVGDGDLNPQTGQVPDFINETNRNLKAMGVKSYDAQIVAHSLGSSNALEAAVDCKENNVKFGSVLLLEPVAASLAVDRLAEGKAIDKDGKESIRLGADKKPLPMKEIMADIVKETVSVRTYADGKNTNSAHLETWKPGSPMTKEEMRARNNKTGAHGYWAAELLVGVGGNTDHIDSDNRMVGTSYLEVIPKEILDKYVPCTALGKADKAHSGNCMVKAQEMGANILPYAEVIKDPKREAKEVQTKPLDKVTPAINQHSSAQALEPYLVAAIEEGAKLLGAFVSGSIGHVGNTTEMLADAGKKNASAPLDPSISGRETGRA